MVGMTSLKRLGDDNFVILKKAFDKHVNDCVGRSSGRTSRFHSLSLIKLIKSFIKLIHGVMGELFDGR